MKQQTEDHVDQWWADLFGVDRAAIWRTVSARPHGKLGDYEGFFVAWRADGVHVSLPAGTSPDLQEVLAAHTIPELQDPAFWHDFAAIRTLTVIGPSTHFYLDVDPGPVTGVVAVAVDESALAPLRGLVTDADWREAGFADEPAYTFGLHEGGVLVAASNLHLFDEQPRDVGVLVAPAARGRGLAAVVARHAASYAVREHGLARWGARDTNLPSLATARRLGFEPWCTQLAIR